MNDTLQAVINHQCNIRACRRCTAMQGPPVTGTPVASPVLLVGQAPGHKEIQVRRPFAWTAGKTLFRWFAGIGISENDFRERVYMSAMCRCYPGKKPRAGDRVPDRHELENCAQWLDREIRLLQPQLVIPVGKLAIARFLEFDLLKQVVGTQLRIETDTCVTDIIPLPHPSGASTWHRTKPGESLLAQALELIHDHSAWQQVILTK